MALRKGKTWFEASADGSLERMKFENAKELIGYVFPAFDYEKTKNWTVVMADESFMDCRSQEEAMMLADTQQILTLLVRKKAKRSRR